MTRTMRLEPEVARWMEPIPPWAGADWCLPAAGGRVLVRGFDTYRSSLTDLDDQWGLDETLVPLTDAAAAKTDGPGGELHPGDCVVFIGTGEGLPRPVVWYPQRVIRVAAGPRGWQRVWAVRNFDATEGSVGAISPKAIPKRLWTNEVLHEADRRLVLELFHLNFDCEYCGARGRGITFGPVIDASYPYGAPMPLSGDWVPRGGDRPGPDDDTYWCLCKARWHVKADGELVLRWHPLSMNLLDEPAF